MKIIEYIFFYFYMGDVYLDVLDRSDLFVATYVYIIGYFLFFDVKFIFKILSTKLVLSQVCIYLYNKTFFAARNSNFSIKIIII